MRPSLDETHRSFSAVRIEPGEGKVPLRVLESRLMTELLGELVGFLEKARRTKALNKGRGQLSLGDLPIAVRDLRRWEEEQLGPGVKGANLTKAEAAGRIETG